jgi:hypothetical protein
MRGRTPTRALERRVRAFEGGDRARVGARRRPSEEELREELALAERVLSWAPGVPRSIELLCEEAEVDVEEWLLGLPRELFSAGWRSGGAGSVRGAGGVIAPTPSRASRSRSWPKRARSNARAPLLEDNLTRYPNDEMWSR